MKVRIDKKWLAINVFNHSKNGKLWESVILDHNCVGDYKFDVTTKTESGKIELYGVRVCFEDERLYRNKLYITVPVSCYQIVEVREAQELMLGKIYEFVDDYNSAEGKELSIIKSEIAKIADNYNINLSKLRADKFLEFLCRKYDLPVREKARDNLMSLLGHFGISSDDRIAALDAYDNYLLGVNALTTLE